MASWIAAWLAFAGLALPSQAAPVSDRQPDTVEFATARVGDFDMNAQTELTWQSGEPLVRNVTCYGRSPSFRISMDRFSATDVFIVGDGPADANGEPRYQFGDLNILWLAIGRHRYETKPISILYPRQKVDDYRYETDPTPRIMLSGFRGYLGFRQSPADPWLKVQLLLPEIMHEATLVAGVKVWNNDPQNSFHILPVTIRVGALRDALKWCEAETHSDTAYRLHPSN